MDDILASGSVSILPTISNPSANWPSLDPSYPSSPSNEKKLGIFMGVYVPCLLGIFGVILFERLSWIVGQAGLLLAIVILILGYTMVTLTTLSLSAIATNGTMRGGGAYYMISRALGPEFGGSVGLIFYTANIIAGGVYLVGFSEGLKDAFSSIPQSDLATLNYSSITLAVMASICLVGAEFYAKSAVVIFLILLISLICGIGSLLFEIPGKTDGYTSWNWDSLNDNLFPNFDDNPDGVEQDFHSIFAVFFPAVTGIMAGANMSGDLQNPAKSIPKGTLFAIATTATIYFLLMVLFGATFTGDELRNEYFAFKNVSFWSPIISLGIFASTLSSALGSIIGSGNILHALAKDELLPLSFLNVESPRRAIILSWVFIQCTLFMNDLNTLATMQTMFFLFSYGITNFACLTLLLTSAPNFRPTWPYFNGYTCGIGVVLCFGGMFYVDILYGSISLLVCLVVFVVILFRQPENNWGDVSQAIMYHQVRKYLLRLDPRKEHVKYWRPQIMLIVGDPEQNFSLIDFVNNLKKGGLYIIGQIIVGDFKRSVNSMKELNEAWRELISSAQLKAFPSVTIAPSIRAGVHNLISTSGVGMLKPNTFVLCFPEPIPSDYASLPTHISHEIFEKFHISGGSSSSSGRELGGEGGEELHWSTTQNSNNELLQQSPELFLNIINDCLFSNKSIIIARNFHLLNKTTLVRESRKLSTRSLRGKYDVKSSLLPKQHNKRSINNDSQTQRDREIEEEEEILIGGNEREREREREREKEIEEKNGEKESERETFEYASSSAISIGENDTSKEHDIENEIQSDRERQREESDREEILRNIERERMERENDKGLKNRKESKLIRGCLSLFSTPKPEKTIDIWLLRWKGEDKERENSTLTFLLLMSHILKLTDIWKHLTKLRVITYVSTLTQSSLQRRKTQMRTLLAQVRINAEIVVASLEESSIYERPQTQNVENDEINNNNSKKEEELSAFSSDETVFVRLNQLIRSYTRNTSIVFLPFPSPPEEVNTESASSFISRLSVLTNSLPPTLLIHSASGSVITDAL